MTSHSCSGTDQIEKAEVYILAFVTEHYWWLAGLQFWLFTLDDKDEADDLSTKEKKLLKDMLKAELEARR